MAVAKVALEVGVEVGTTRAMIIRRKISIKVIKMTTIIRMMMKWLVPSFFLKM